MKFLALYPLNKTFWHVFCLCNVPTAPTGIAYMPMAQSPTRRREASNILKKLASSLYSILRERAYVFTPASLNTQMGHYGNKALP